MEERSKEKSYEQQADSMTIEEVMLSTKLMV